MNTEQIKESYLQILKQLNDEARQEIEALPRHLDPQSRTRGLIRIEQKCVTAAQPFVAELARIEMMRVPSPVYVERNPTMPLDVCGDTLAR